MAITLQTVELWSKTDQAIVTWDVAMENDAPNDPSVEIPVVVLRYKEEFHKFSPNTTDVELLRQITAMNEEK